MEVEKCGKRRFPSGDVAEIASSVFKENRTHGIGATRLTKTVTAESAVDATMKGDHQPKMSGGRRSRGRRDWSVRDGEWKSSGGCAVRSRHETVSDANGDLNCVNTDSGRSVCFYILGKTLVHSTLEPCKDADFAFPVNFNLKDHTIYVRCRPFLKNFLERVATLFETIIFTASQSIYAEQLLNKLDPKRKLFRHRVFRESCVYVEGNYLKDLSVLGRDLARVVIIDNSPQREGRLWVAY
ncbi:hypothetical protein KSP40_PGU001928 [Platanthera guangdongensis]|uniref:Mitochondrial import inner membrane translocase subunit TIM50 n=1 Tax=Platanthera guangdongensis TaxID=2320717 RepID=A0ABR2LWJ8_9ASPA